MHLIDYINTYEDWENLITKSPYNITVKTDGRYKLLKYNQIESDFSLQEVVEARGCIVRKDFDGQWIYVCKPFDKFFNYGESCAAPIDWSSTFITEKVDGSLMKLWHSYGIWRLSTNGTIDAFKASINGTDTTYGELFERILGTSISQFANNCFLDYDSTYMFEMTSPETRIVIPYEDGIYFLARKSNYDGYEYLDPLSNFAKSEMVRYGINFPKRYEFHNLEEVITYAEGMSAQEEGFVVRDAHGRRVKVKSPAYLKVAHIFAKGEIGKVDILRMMCEGTIDDFVGYFPEYRFKVLDVRYDISIFCKTLNTYWDLYGAAASKKEYAEKVKNLTGAPLLFKKYIDNTFNIDSYVWNEMDYKKLARMLGYI